MKHMRTPWIAVALSLALFVSLLALGGSRAWASTFGFDLTAPNPAISGFNGPYVHVTVTMAVDGSSSATVAFHSLSAVTGGISYTYLMGDGSAIALNPNGAATATYSTPTNALNGTDGWGSFFSPSTCPSPPCLTNGGSGVVDGFGSFAITANEFNGFTKSFTDVTATLTSSGTWANASSVLLANSTTINSAAAHIFVTGTTTAACGTAACATGFAGSGAAVPEPGTLALLGSGLVGLGTVVRKRFFGSRQERG